MSTLAESAILLTIDRLGAGFIGPYGNTWIETPEFNRLASQSLLCETAISDSPLLDVVFRSYWTGRHAACSANSDAPSLLSRANAAGVRTILLTDDAALAEHPLAAEFSERIAVPVDDVARAAAEIEDTQLARLFQAAIGALGELKPPFLLWIHSRGMAGEWDAPAEHRNQFAGEDDPLPGDFTAPPEMRLANDADPDELLKIAHAYAAQVTVVDLCLGALLDAIDEQPFSARTLLAVTSPRGYPLGEHGRVGACDHALYAELLQVPLLVRMPGGFGALQRTQAIVQPADLFDLVVEAIGLNAKSTGLLTAVLHDQAHAGGNIAVALAPQQRAIRTPAWFLREEQVEGETRRELFAKPDDRWEVNEVASRGGEAVDLLVESIDRFLAAAESGTLHELPPLPEPLCDLWR